MHLRCLTCVVLLLTACSGPKAPPEPTIELEVVDACRLLLPREAEAAAGMQLDTVGAAIDKHADTRAAKCSFGINTDDQFRMVALEVRQYPTVGEAKKKQADSERSLPRLTASDVLTPVEGVGERAIWTGGDLSQLHAVAGHRRLIVTMEIGEPAHRQAQAIEIAKRAFHRLEGNATEASPPGQFQMMVSEEPAEAAGT